VFSVLCDPHSNKRQQKIVFSLSSFFCACVCYTIWLVGFSSTMASSSSFSEDMFIIHPVTARRVLRKRKRQCTGCKLDNFFVFCFLFYFTFTLLFVSNKIYPLTSSSLFFRETKKKKKKNATFYINSAWYLLWMAFPRLAKMTAFERSSARMATLYPPPMSGILKYSFFLFLLQLVIYRALIQIALARLSSAVYIKIG
jgi:hypothetical protein